MNKKVTTVLCGAGVGAALLLAAPVAGADPSTTNNTNDWGQAVSGCNTGGGCYNGGTRGSYVSGQTAQNPNGFATNLHTTEGQYGPANPGNSANHAKVGTH